MIETNKINERELTSESLNNSGMNPSMKQPTNIATDMKVMIKPSSMAAWTSALPLHTLAESGYISAAAVQENDSVLSPRRCSLLCTDISSHSAFPRRSPTPQRRLPPPRSGCGTSATQRQARRTAPRGGPQPEGRDPLSGLSIVSVACFQGFKYLCDELSKNKLKITFLKPQET